MAWFQLKKHCELVQEVQHIAELHMMCFPPFQERRDLCPSCVIVSNRAKEKKIVSVIPHLLLILCLWCVFEWTLNPLRRISV